MPREIDQLLTELHSGVQAATAAHRVEIDQLLTELHSGVQAATAAHRVEIAGLRTEVTRAFEAPTRRIVGVAFALTGLALTAARFDV